MLNLQGGQTPRKIIQAQSLEHSEPSIVYSMATVHNQRKTKVTGVPQLITTAVPSNIIEAARSSSIVTASISQMKGKNCLCVLSAVYDWLFHIHN